MNKKKLIIISIILIVCSLGVGLLGGYFISKGDSKSSPLSNNTSNSDLLSGDTLYRTNSDTYKQTKTYNIGEIKPYTNEKYKFPEIDPKKVKITPQKSDELTNNIEILDVVYVKQSFNGALQIHAKNKNTKSVSIDFVMEFYDSTGKKIWTSTGHPGTFTFPDTEFGVELDFSSPREYSSYEVKYYAREVDSQHQSYDELKNTKYYIIQEGNGDIDVLFKNQTDHDISGVCFSFLLYKNDKLVWADSSINSDIDDITPGTGTVISSYVSIYNKIEYDDMKVIFCGAYTIKNQG